jgi:WD40 repeat protein/tRNA A-37 threonylcarbamoyl transferase component Bud32
MQPTSSHTDPPTPSADFSDTLPHLPSAPVAVGAAPEGYEILAELGRGGNGVVYRARHHKLNRLVALKMILKGVHADPGELARFLAEAEAVAQLQHPNIVQIFESGQHGGLPFFTLELVPGGSLAERVRRQTLPAREAAALVEQLARGTAYAHERGILHRDLKPENVLLAADGTPKITDFGLAKRVAGGPDLTTSGAVMGTPPYMAPEQASGQTNAVGPRTDVYALGAVLYHLLTGRPPFQAATPVETVLQVITLDPVAPCQLQPQIPRDLETICLCCLRKEPHRRYAGALALADDLRRFLAGEPVAARPVGRLERAVKWCRRRPAVAGLLAALAVLAAAAAAVVIAQYGETLAALHYAHQQEEDARDQKLLAERRKELADQAAETARRQKIEAEKNAAAALRAEELAGQRADALARSLANSNVLLAQSAFNEGDVAAAQALLDLVPPTLRSFDWHYLKRHFTGGQFTLYGHTGAVRSVSFSGDGLRLASAGDDGSIKLWDARTGQELATLRGHPGPVTSVAFCGDGQRLASAGHGKMVRVWDARTGQPLAALEGRADIADRVLAFSGDGQRLAFADGDGVRLWDARTGQELTTLRGHVAASLAFSADGQRLASADLETVKLWDTRTGQVLLSLRYPGSVGVALSADGQRLASASMNSTLKLWDARSGQLVATLGNPGPLRAAAFSGDGQRVAAAGEDGTVRLWDVTSRQQLAVLRGHRGFVLGAAFSADGQRLASAGADRTVKLWDARGGPPCAALRGHANRVSGVAFSGDGSRLASAGTDSTVRLWDGRSGELLASLRGHDGTVGGVAFSGDGRRLASAGWDKTVRLWDGGTGQPLATLRGHGGMVMGVAFSGDGSRLASAGMDRTVRLWDAGTGRELATLEHPDRVASVAFSPDGGRLVAAAAATLYLWDAHTGRLLTSWPADDILLNSVAFSGDGRRLASAGYSQTVKLWDAHTGQLRATLRGHGGVVTGVAFSADGQRVASASQDGTVKLWDAHTGQLLVTLRGTEKLDGVAFSGDGLRLAAAAWDKKVLLWSGHAGPERLTFRDHVFPVTGVAVDAGGRLVSSVDQSGKILTWDVATAKPMPTRRGWPTQASWALHPDHTALALVHHSEILVVDLRPPDAAELGYRQLLARFDPDWHREQFVQHREAADFPTHLPHLLPAALAHLDQLLAHQPTSEAVGQRYRFLLQARPKVPSIHGVQAALATSAHHQGDAMVGQLAAAKLLALVNGKDTSVTLLAARTAVLCPRAPADLAPALAALRQLPAKTRSTTDCWIEGGLLLRQGDPESALPLLEQAVTERAGDGPPHAELLLAIACKKLGRADDARRWLARAAAWLDGRRLPLQAGSGVLTAAGQPLAAWPALQVQDQGPDPRRLAWGWQVWEELLVLRREAEQ